MKASEYAQWIEDNKEDPEMLPKLGRKFLEETIEESKKVINAPLATNDSFYQFFRSMNDKWRLLVRMVNTTKSLPYTLRVDGYKDMVKLAFPELYEVIQWEK